MLIVFVLFHWLLTSTSGLKQFNYRKSLLQHPFKNTQLMSTPDNNDYFKDLKLIERHRLIYHLVGEELKSSIHAFSVQAKTPEQYSLDPSIIKSPPCLGGSKSKN